MVLPSFFSFGWSCLSPLSSCLVLFFLLSPVGWCCVPPSSSWVVVLSLLRHWGWYRFSTTDRRRMPSHSTQKEAEESSTSPKGAGEKAPLPKGWRGRHHHPNEGEEGSTTKRRRRPSSPTRKGGEERQHHPKGEGKMQHHPKWVMVLSSLAPGAASSASCGWSGRYVLFELKNEIKLE